MSAARRGRPHGCVCDIKRAARAEGFAAGIEAAAKVAEGFEVTDYGQHIASAIRSLASRPGK